MPPSLGLAKLYAPDQTESMTCRWVSLHGEHDSESRLAADHTVIGGGGLFERECLDHGTDAGQGAKIERVFRVSCRPGRPALNRSACADQLNRRYCNRIG